MLLNGVEHTPWLLFCLAWLYLPKDMTASMDVGPTIYIVGILHIGSCTDSWQHPMGVLPVAIDLMTVSVKAS